MREVPKLLQYTMVCIDVFTSGAEAHAEPRNRHQGIMEVRTDRGALLIHPCPHSMQPAPSLVSVVDDDESVRESLPDLLREFGFAAQAFSSAEEFLSSDFVVQTQCLLLDVTMPGMSGPELQQELTRRDQRIPIVFITARGEAGVRPLVLAHGAVECLLKPFSESALLDALTLALRVA